MMQRELVLDSNGVRLEGALMFPASREKPPLIVLCHGIPSGAAPAPGDTGYESLARRCVQGGAASCYFSFRGTGLSQGDFSLGGWARDLETLLSAARGGSGAFAGCDPERIALMGFSGGGAVSIICAARHGPFAGVAALSAPAAFSPLTTREDMEGFIAHARAIGIIRDPSFPPSRDEYYEDMIAHDPIDFVGRVAPTPLLIIHGDADETVPVRDAQSLYDAAAEPKELFIVRGGGHKLRLNPEAMDKAVAWTLARLKPLL